MVTLRLIKIRPAHRAVNSKLKIQNFRSKKEPAMQLCNPTLGLEKFVESYARVMFKRAPEFHPNPDDPHAPLAEYTRPEDQKGWRSLSDTARKIALFEENFRITRHPLWQEVSGMYSRLENPSPIVTREAQAARLALAVYHLIGAELQREDEKPHPAHTTFWDPVRKICHQFEIAKSKLDALSRESIGMSTHEMVDRHRVARIKTRWYADLFPIAQAWSQSLKPHALERLPNRDAKFALLKFIRATRREDGTDRGALALSLRIPSFARLHRACMIHHGQTPLQIELEAIDQLIRELKNPTVARASRPPSTSDTPQPDPQLVQKNTESESPAEGGAEHSCPPADTPPPASLSLVPQEEPQLVQKNTDTKEESQHEYEARLIKEYSEEYGFDIEAAWGHGNDAEPPQI
jgi:hypothetical protein